MYSLARANPSIQDTQRFEKDQFKNMITHPAVPPWRSCFYSQLAVKSASPFQQNVIMYITSRAVSEEASGAGLIPWAQGDDDIFSVSAYIQLGLASHGVIESMLSLTYT